MQRCARIGRQNVKGGSLNPLPDSPCDRMIKNCLVVFIHAEHETAVDHHAMVVKPAYGGSVVAAKILKFSLLLEIRLIGGLKPNKQAPQSAGHRLLEEFRRQHRVHSSRRLPETAHASHAIKERIRKTRIAEQMIVEEIQVTSRQTIDLGQRVVHGLGVERLPSREERLLVTEVAHVRTA